MTPAEQQARFGEVVHVKTYRCTEDGCKEVSSVKTLDGGHLCIDHYLEKENHQNA